MAEVLAILPIISGITTFMNACMIWSERWDQKKANGQAARRLADALHITLEQIEAGLGKRTRATPGMVLALHSLEKYDNVVYSSSQGIDIE
jgi:hypothetical protein